jgi:dTDP-4-dehydrorhamnose reductase
MKKIILITGAGGMFGQDACELFTRWGYEVIAAKKSDLDVTNFTAVKKFFAEKKIDFVLHAAAYTKVDEAESNRDLAFLINAESAKNVAAATAEKNLPIFYISTDYVFDGEKGAPYFVNDATNPLNVYGASKLVGEENIKKINPQHYVVRTSWLYGKHGKNFVDSMLDLAQKQSILKVVNDQFGCPTWTHDLAVGIQKLIAKKKPFGTYQICGSGVTTWYEFATEIFKICKIKIEVMPVKSEEFSSPARRPKFSAMANDKTCRDWREALSDYLCSKN